MTPRFQDAARQAGATASDAELTAAAERLVARWSETQRHYHTVTHLTAVLKVVDQHAGHAAHPERVRLAAWLHDAVYDPRATDGANERESAELAENLLVSLGVPDEVAADVARLVRVTARHRSDDPDSELLCDADLAILGSDKSEYEAYVRGIRQEYAHVNDDDFATGRAKILTDILALKSIFRNEEMQAEWEERARNNLARELEMLRAT